MFLKLSKPKTPSQRHTVKFCRKFLTKNPKLKSKIVGMKKQAGKSNKGQITVRHKGGGHKKRYRIIDFKRKTNVEGIIFSIEYDPNRNCNISAVFALSDSIFFYIITPLNLKIGDIIKSGNDIESKLGYALPLKEIPAGSYIHNIAVKKADKAVFTRSAGTYSILLEKSKTHSKIKLSSNITKWVSNNCFATIGIVSNDFMFLTKKGKAGHSRWVGKRPTVRGVAMNPVDHPNGGGEGKKSGRKRTPWGKKK